MRTGSTITASQITAIEIDGQWNSQAGTYTSMLTMGDVGCAQIVGNLGEGVIGTNTILNIDAVIHDFQGDNNGLYDHLWFVRDPSNNTGKLFNMCYTHVSTPINVIYARRNIWVQPNNTNQNPPASTYFFTNSTVCGTQIPPPTFVPAPKSACVGSTLDCVPCEETQKEEEESDTAATVATIIAEAFSEAYADFIEEDNEETRDGFDEVAVLKLDYDSMSGAYSLTTVAGEVFPVNDSTVHRILVAKVLKEDSSDTEKIDAEDIFAEHYADLFATSANKKVQQFIVYPNPSSGKFTIQKKQDSEVSVIRISDLFASLLYSSQIDEKISLEANRFPAGIYVIKGIGTDGIVKDIERLVIQ